MKIAAFSAGSMEMVFEKCSTLKRFSWKFSCRFHFSAGAHKLIVFCFVWSVGQKILHALLLCIFGDFFIDSFFVAILSNNFIKFCNSSV